MSLDLKANAKVAVTTSGGRVHRKRVSSYHYANSVFVGLKEANLKVGRKTKQEEGKSFALDMAAD